MFKRKPSFLNVLAAALNDNPIWRNLAQTATVVINQVISEPRWALQRIREPEVIQRGDWIETPVGDGQVTLYKRIRSNINSTKNTYDFQDFVEVEVNSQKFVTAVDSVLQDRTTLINSAKNLGFNYFSDGFQDDDYGRINANISKLWKAKGGDHFIKFMGFSKRFRLEIQQLYTEAIGDPGEPSPGTTPANSLDYYPNFYPFSEYLTKEWDRPEFDPTTSTDTPLIGSFYPTGHVMISYDILSDYKPDKLELLSYFYFMAPIHLVLQAIQEEVGVHIDYNAANADLLYTIQQKSLKIDLS